MNDFRCQGLKLKKNMQDSENENAKLSQYWAETSR